MYISIIHMCRVKQYQYIIAHARIMYTSIPVWNMLGMSVVTMAYNYVVRE